MTTFQSKTKASTGDDVSIKKRNGENYFGNRGNAVRGATEAAADEEGEGLARGIVTGAAQAGEGDRIGNRIERGVAAGDNQRSVGKGRFMVFKQAGEQVTGHVIDPDARQLADHGHSFGKGETDEKRAHQPRTAGGGNKADITQPGICLAQGCLHHWPDHLNVPARGQLRDDAAIGGMHLILAGWQG